MSVYGGKNRIEHKPGFLSTVRAIYHATFAHTINQRKQAKQLNIKYMAIIVIGDGAI